MEEFDDAKPATMRPMQGYLAAIHTSATRHRVYIIVA